MWIREDCQKGENSRLGTGRQMSYQRSWKNSRLEKRNIQENSCLGTEKLTVSKGFCENFSLEKGKLQA
jgi:hypothetical protein